LSRGGLLSGYAYDEKFERVADKVTGDVEKPFPFMLRRLLFNHQKDLEKCKL
jgi:hypothetical protein